MSDDDPTIVILAEHYGCVADILAERDRLRAVVDAAAGGAGKTLAQVLADVMDERDRLRAVVDAAAGEVNEIAHETAGRLMTDRARNLARWLRLSLVDLDAVFEQLDVSPTIGGMTPAEAYEFYADPANQEPQGPPVRRFEMTEGQERTITDAMDLNRHSAEAAGEHYIVDRMMGRCTSCGTIGAHQPFCPLYDPGDEGEMVPPVHGRGDRSTPHTPNKSQGVQDTDPSAAIAVDPTSPTYDPDEYGTFTQADGARNSPLGGTDMAAILETLDATHPDRENPFHEWLGRKLEAGDAGDEQPSEDVQGRGLPGSAVAAEEVVAGDAPADEGGAGEERDAGTGAAPARGEVGPGVGGGEWVDL